MRVAPTWFVAALLVLVATTSVQAWGASVSAVDDNVTLCASSQKSSTENTTDSSALSRLTTGTKKFFTGIRDAVTPKSSTRKTTTRYYTPSSALREKTSQQQKSSLTSWLRPKESSKK